MGMCRLRTTRLDVVADIGEGGPSASICCCSVVQSCPQSRPITTLGLLVVAVHCCVQIFATPWIAARQASLSITNSQSLLKLMSVESVMPSNHLILCRPLLLLPPIFPSIRVFSNESVLCISGQRIGASASASVLPMNIQG